MNDLKKSLVTEVTTPEILLVDASRISFYVD